MSDDRVQRLIAEACLEGVVDLDLRARATRLGVSDADLTVLTNKPQRLSLYRRLVRSNLLGVTSRMVPRARARLDASIAGEFERSFDLFLAKAAPTTHYLRDVPAEFLGWVKPHWDANPRVPPFASDLARHELVYFQIAIAPRLTKPQAVAELALHKRLVFVPARRLMRYAYAVHELPDALEDRTQPERRPVSLLVYRDEENSVRVLELTPLAALIAEELLAGSPLGLAMANAAANCGTALTEEVLASSARMLADWGERGILLGAEG